MYFRRDFLFLTTSKANDALYRRDLVRVCLIFFFFFFLFKSCILKSVLTTLDLQTVRGNFKDSYLSHREGF